MPEPQIAPIQSPWLMIHEAARRAKVSSSTIRNAIRDGELRAAGGGGKRVLIHVEWVDAWVIERPRGGRWQ